MSISGDERHSPTDANQFSEVNLNDRVAPSTPVTSTNPFRTSHASTQYTKASSIQSSPQVLQQPAAGHISFEPNMTSPRFHLPARHQQRPVAEDDGERSRPLSAAGKLSPFVDQEIHNLEHSMDNEEDRDGERTLTPTDTEMVRAKSVMKRNRWGTRKHKDGRPKAAGVQRKGTLMARVRHHGHHREHSAATAKAAPDEDDEGSNERRIFYNTPLPADMLDPESGLPLADYPRNKVRTTKYTPLSFVPKNLFFQFQNVANIFFLLIVILGAFPIFGVLSPGLAAVPIIVIVVITMIKDAIEDYRRTLLDMELNNTVTQILKGVDNPNVTDENVSVWRQFKKACTRGTIKTFRFFKGFKKSDKSQTSAAASDSNDLSKVKTIESIYSLESLAPTERNKHSRNSLESVNSFMSEIAPSTYQKSAAARSIVDRTAPVSGNAKFKRDFWKSVKVGDIVRINNNDEIPADVVVLATSDPDGACYVETKNLDGETNLKVREALKAGAGIKHARDLERASFWIESEKPQPNLYTFFGVLKWLDSADPSTPLSEPISINNMLLRGCSLRNTDWAIGVTIFTGDETKIMLNAGITPTKRSRMTRELNLSVFFNFGLLFVTCFSSAVINGVYHKKNDTSETFFGYGMIGGNPPAAAMVTFFAALILYQAIVPISLYISIEIVKTIQAFFIYSDDQMYYAPLDYPCTPKSWNISDDLGQIEYIFSDKTGTLTQNVMEFKKCTIAGMTYGKAYTEALAGLRRREGIDTDEEGARLRAEIAQDKIEMLRDLRNISDNPQLYDEDLTFVSTQFVKDIRESTPQASCNKHFMLVLALCHSVICEESKKVPGKIEFKAQSPDEAALVGTAKDMGFRFKERTNKGVIVNVQGVDTEFTILNTIEFNSTRKRMSAIVKFRDADRERYLLICKGADSVIYSRLKAGEQEQLRAETALHLEQFANEGLRTLCLAEREIEPEIYHQWAKRHQEAAEALVDRDEKMEATADEIECDLTLLGGTAIEDRLQDGVPESIALLGRAGVKLWVLTGDKVETAINIGFSCNLLDNSMELIILRATTMEETDKILTEHLAKFGFQGTPEEIEEAKKDHTLSSTSHALVIDGDTLKLALQGPLKFKLLMLCKQCRSVLCCRVSPAQKAAVVRLVKKTLEVMTLSIGDGANDVAMIQEADVGVGIAGEEGRQAVMSSDYAIGQFRFLSRLLLVHGRWSYKRLGEMIPNFFYKNVVFTFALYWYGIFNSFDGTYLFEYSYVTFFNLAFTSLPVILMGILDQDIPDYVSLQVPQLYKRGILRLEWNQVKFWRYMCEGLVHSFIAFFFPYWAWQAVFSDASGCPLNHREWMGVAACVIAVAACNLYILFNQYRWDWFSLVINVISTLLIFAWTGFYSSFTFSQEFYSAAVELFGSAVFWATCFVGVVACVIPQLAYKSYNQMFRPADIDIVREQWQAGKFGSDPHSGDATESKELISAPISTRSSVDVPAYDEQSVLGDVPQMSHSPEQERSGSALGKRISSGFRKSQQWISKRHTLSPNDGLSGVQKFPEEDEIGLVGQGNGGFVEPDQLSRFDSYGGNSLAYHNSMYSLDQVPSNQSITALGGNTDQVGPYNNSMQQGHFQPPQLPSQLSHHEHLAGSKMGDENDIHGDEVDNILQRARLSIHMEQPFPRQSLEQFRHSVDNEDITTAHGLMRINSNLRD